MSGILRSYDGLSPRLDASVFVAETAVVIGDVVAAPGASIWYGCVLRGDSNRIVIGEGTNIQDGTVIHVDHDPEGDYRETGGGLPTLIGSHITVGHQALLHACTLEDGCFVGMRAVVMDAAVIESGAMVAAGALVTPRKRVPSGQLWAGSPAKYLRDLTAEEKQMMWDSPRYYAILAASYLAPA
ncbi:MAG: gamma carbonic anhydrase family protein [Rhodospirillales bacterium]